MLCRDCPRCCGVDRDKFNGFCRMGGAPVIARAAAHMWEEPCISGTRGSGTVFFCGCNLRCKFCQNHTISRGDGGKTVTVDELARIYLRLQESGVHNINLVTPSHYVRAVAQSLEAARLRIPVVYNSGGYDSVEGLRTLEGKVNIYMPDFKFFSTKTARSLADAPDYPTVVRRAIDEMYRQVGPYELDENGLLVRGVLIRHLVLPDHTDESVEILRYINDTFGSGRVLVSLMSQYTPVLPCPLPDRRLTPDEYEAVRSFMENECAFDGYAQELTSANESYIPPFNCEGI